MAPCLTHVAVDHLFGIFQPFRSWLLSSISLNYRFSFLIISGLLLNLALLFSQFVPIFYFVTVFNFLPIFSFIPLISSFSPLFEASTFSLQLSFYLDLVGLFFNDSLSPRGVHCTKHVQVYVNAQKGYWLNIAVLRIQGSAIL